ncbi:MAG: FliH/SctL family protein, partial [Halieaceae bacterium]|nr:FliH/SctL family protein [Halieaceae bacterium]
MSEPAITPWSPPSLSVVTPASARQEYEQTLAAGRQQGYNEGLQQGLAEGRRQAQTLLAEMSAIWEAMQAPFLDLEQEVQTQLLGLSVAVARAVVERELRTDDAAIERALGAALESLAEASSGLQVVLNPEDKARIEDLLEQQRISAELIPNPNMMRGGCQLRRGGALVDASIESRMMVAIETLAFEQNAEISDE